MRRLQTAKLAMGCLAAGALLLGCISMGDEPPKESDYVNDEVTAARVRQALSARRSRPYRNVQVTVTNGVVYLTGTVKSDAEQRKVEQVVREVEGVEGVDNKVRVASAPSGPREDDHNRQADSPRPSSR